MECSARTGEGVKEVFEHATRVALPTVYKGDAGKSKDEFDSVGKPYKLTPFQKVSAFIYKSAKGKQRATNDEPPSESILATSQSIL
jgi:hypothetical protein